LPTYFVQRDLESKKSLGEGRKRGRRKKKEKGRAGHLPSRSYFFLSFDSWGKIRGGKRGFEGKT